MFKDTRPATLDACGAGDPWATFRVDDHAEVRRLLQQLRDGAVPVVLSTPQGLAISGQLWSLDPVREQLNFNADGDTTRLRAVALADEAVAISYLDSVKLQFDLVEMLLVQGRQTQVLRARWPRLLYRFQRRAGYRVRTLERHAPKARLHLASMPLALRIVDVSVGGCALALPGELPPPSPGVTLPMVRIELDGDTAFNADLKVQHASPLHDLAGGVRLGCEMVSLGTPAQRALQRYIDRTQQRRRLLSR